MKTILNFKHIAVIGIIGAVLMSSCAAPVRDNHNRPNRNHSSDYRRGYERGLRNNERRISEFKNTKHRDDVLEVEARHNNLKRRLDEFKGNSKHEWKSFKKDFNHDIKNINKSLKGINKKNKKR